jgi:UDP-N-acetyl-D-mannosaminuronic acid transferase (WecB/TagA/CpsF family)
MRACRPPSPASPFRLRYGSVLAFICRSSLITVKVHTILGIRFFGGTSREAVDEISRNGGLLVAPAAPSMINLCRDEDYRRALLASDLAIADSGFMVLLWRLFAGEQVPRISGLEHVKRLLEHESVRQPGAALWVVPTESSREKLLAFVRRLRIPAVEDDVYIAPKYGEPVADEALLQIVRQRRPRHVVIAVGGGVQDKLGRYLFDRLDHRPAIHCIGAALGFLTGDQARIPDWADKYFVGWFFRSLAQPKVFVPRFWSARKLPWLIARYRDRLPPMVR